MIQKLLENLESTCWVHEGGWPQLQHAKGQKTMPFHRFFWGGVRDTQLLVADRAMPSTTFYPFLPYSPRFSLASPLEVRQVRVLDRGLHRRHVGTIHMGPAEDGGQQPGAMEVPRSQGNRVQETPSKSASLRKIKGKRCLKRT